MATFVLAACLGWAAGICINYFADILPVQRRLGPPICLGCQSSFRTLRNYLFWPRRCVNCGRRRSWRTWIVEVVCLAFSLWLWTQPEPRLAFPLSWCLLVYFGVVIVVDVEHRLILHMVSLVGAGLSGVAGVGLHGWWSTVLGGIAGLLSMLGLYVLGIVLMRTIGRWRGQAVEEDALGFGDVILNGVLGLILGWPGILAGLVLTIFLAGAASLVYLVFKVIRRQYRADMALPYGPFLVISTVLLLFFRNWFMN